MAIPKRWTWKSTGSASSRVWEELDDAGLSWFHWPEALEAGSEPWKFATALLGCRPLHLHVKQIAPLAGDVRNYENSSFTAPLHTDYHPYLPAPLQVLICHRPAQSGGDSLFLDGWELLASIRERDPSLYAELFESPRIIPFGPGNWFGPTLSMRLDNLILACGAMPPADPVGRRFVEQTRAASARSLRLEEGDVVVLNHHRLLHGRTAFSDPHRLLTRFFLWLHKPLAAEPRLAHEARRVHRRLAEQTSHHPEWIRHRLGVFGSDGLPATAFSADPKRLPAMPDAQSPERYVELENVLRGLALRDSGCAARTVSLAQ